MNEFAENTPQCPNSSAPGPIELEPEAQSEESSAMKGRASRLWDFRVFMGLGFRVFMGLGFRV